MEPKEKTKDVFEIVTEQILQKLNAGKLPWREHRTFGLPRNYVSGNAYRGVNVLLLSHLGYARNIFLTFQQAKELGAGIRKGEKGHLVTHMQKRTGRKTPVLTYYHVFNISQCENLPDEPETLTDITPIELCEMILADIPNRPDIAHIENEAYYDRTRDYINMPKMETFAIPEDYYAWLFKQLAFATGHETRLNRPHYIGTENLIAEITTCYLCSYAGISADTLPYGASPQAWIKTLGKDARFIVCVCAQAQKAADWILNVKHFENRLADELQPGYAA